MSNHEVPQEVPQFDYFTETYQQAMIAECGFRIAEYAQAEDIGTIVLIDKAARNLYIPIREASRQLNPDIKPPTIYFLNPTGFMSPEQHDEVDYLAQTGQGMSEDSPFSESTFYDIARNDPELFSDITAIGQAQRILDRIRGGQQGVAREFTPLVDRAIKHDEQFNGSVLVLDACMHSGGSMRGITNALKDVGIIDVRTGVVNAIRNKTGQEPDFVVFADDEIRDDCKPFGPQKEFKKGMAGSSMTSTISERGLSQISRLARRELHMIMENSEELRGIFNKPALHKASSPFPFLDSLLQELQFESPQQHIGSPFGGLIMPDIQLTEFIIPIPTYEPEYTPLTLTYEEIEEITARPTEYKKYG